MSDGAGQSDLLDQINEVAREARALIEAAEGPSELERARLQTLGRKGSLSALLKLPGQASSPEERKALGQALNGAKRELQALIEERRGALGATAGGGLAADVSLPGRREEHGGLHPLSVVEREVLRVMGALGFEVAEGPEVEDEFHNFIALNIPPHHPARDAEENFYLEDELLLRSQTSTVQIRTLQATQPPVRIVAPGRVFRPDTVDATHHYMFHQVEGLAVEEGLSMRDLKATLLLFFRGLFGEDVGLRLRPSFFPFTEPSAEVDVYFPDKQSWVEIGGCGMVDPAVFEAVDIDPERYQGFAFGLGLERIAMRHFQVPDIRAFTDNDVRFLRHLA